MWVGWDICKVVLLGAFLVLSPCLIRAENDQNTELLDISPDAQIQVDAERQNEPPLERVVFITNGEWPPFTSKSLPFYGAASQVVKEAFRLVGVRVQFEFYPWARAFHLAKSNIKWIGTMPWMKTDERQQVFLYSDVLMTIEGVFFYLEERGFDWKEWDDLRRLVVGETTGYAYGPDYAAAKEKGIFSTFSSSDDVVKFKRLLNKRIDVVPIAKEVGQFLLHKHFHRADVARVTFHPKPVFREKYHLLLKKTDPRSKPLLAKFNQGLKKLKSTGLYQKIVNPEWVIPDTDESSD